MKDVATVYVGCAVPDREEYRNAAFSVAGNLFQTNFLRSFEGSSLPRPDLVEFISTPSFPHIKKLFFGRRRDELWPGYPAEYMPFINFGPLRIASLAIGSFFRLLAWARKNRGRQRLAFVYNMTAPPLGAIVAACRLTKTKLIVLLQDINVPGEVVPNTFLRRVEFALQLRSVAKVDGMLVANKAMVDDFAPGKPFLLMAGGVPAEFLDRFEANPAPPHDTFNIVFAGQLSVLNGVELLANAMKLVKDPSVRVTIAGRGPLAEVAERAAAEDSRITYLGLIPREQVLDLYENADLLVNLRSTGHATERYVFPSKLVECLATGRAVLSTCTGHTEEEFGSFVYLLRDETPEALANQIESLAKTNPAELQSKGKLTQTYVRQHKTWEAYAAILEEYVQAHVLTEEAREVRVR